MRAVSDTYTVIKWLSVITTMASAVEKIDVAIEAVLNQHVFSILPDIIVCFYFA